MDSKRAKQISKFLSLILRHKPEKIGLELDENGWGDVSYITKNTNFNRTELNYVVANNEKQRFSLSRDGNRIRANQGHSIKVELDLEEIAPPDTLYHGTVSKFLDSIFKSGLAKQTRQHVHMSGDLETATNVGQRRGKPIILEINAKQMAEDGYKFYLSKNKVWLTDSVPATYLTIHNFAVSEE